MINMDLLEKLFFEYALEKPCLDNSCPECKEIQQLYESDTVRKLVDGIVRELKPYNYQEDILHTFYLGLKMGRELEKS